MRLTNASFLFSILPFFLPYSFSSSSSSFPPLKQAFRKENNRRSTIELFSLSSFLYLSLFSIPSFFPSFLPSFLPFCTHLRLPPSPFFCFFKNSSVHKVIKSKSKVHIITISSVILRRIRLLSSLTYGKEQYRKKEKRKKKIKHITN